MKNIAIFASGKGTNAENICSYFKGSSLARVALLCSNKKDAPVISHLKKHSVPTLVFSKNDMNFSDLLEKKLEKNSIDLIVLAGFLLKIPEKIINLYDKKIINIHPSLLPKYGGKGMYGKYVHESVLKNNELESSVTIHFVNKNYDEGDIILQKKFSLSKNETIKSLSHKIHSLEMSCFPKVIEKILLS